MKHFTLRHLFLISLLYSYTGTGFQQGHFRVQIDFAQFRFDQDENYLEIYYSYDESQLTYEKHKDGSFRGAVLFSVTVSSLKDDSMVVQRLWRATHTAKDTTNFIEGQRFVGVITILSPVERHRLNVVAFDENNRTRKDRSSFEIGEKAFTSDRLVVSDLQLSSSIRKIAEEQENVFYKNTFEVIPNPTRMYGVGAPVLFYYVEAYNLLTSVKKGQYYTRVSVVSSDSQEVLSQERAKSRMGESSVEVGTVNINALPSGSYRLVFTLIDSIAGTAVHAAKRFLIYNPHREQKSIEMPEAGGIVAVELATMDETGLDKEFALAEYIATRQEKAKYKKLFTTESKRDFLIDFWKRRGANTQMEANVYRREYIGRVERANNKYGSGIREGWKTDRGRIFIIYGEPSEYERHINDIGARPYEIWYYHIVQGGVIFVFADIFGFQDYELIHSTHRGELQDYNWRSKVRENY